MVRTRKSPRCILIAGPNGAGKTTFAREFLPKNAGIVNFVNADLIASGLSPLRPELAARAAGRLVLAELDRLAKARADFAFESTLSGIGYVARLKRVEGGRLSDRDGVPAPAIAAACATAHSGAGKTGWTQCAAGRRSASVCPRMEKLSNCLPSARRRVGRI